MGKGEEVMVAPEQFVTLVVNILLDVNFPTKLVKSSANESCEDVCIKNQWKRKYSWSLIPILQHLLEETII